MKKLVSDLMRRSRAGVTPREWNDIRELLASALELPTAERAAFLDRACATQPGLRVELDSLIAAHGSSGPLDRPLVDWLEPIAQRTSDVSIGRVISHYQVLEKLGGGGMGVVYKARDLRLERTVALKFLPPHVVGEEAKQRFLQEAQAAAVLEHPNICTVLEVGETERGQLFIAMPFYDGETLKRRVARGPVPWRESVALTLQAARGLVKAHERGIVHRDIKSANLLITSDGLLKIVDFGIAKLSGATVTRPGASPGTVAYMSPEQASGEAVDARTDIWSLGIVLYELLTGERPFRAGTDSLLLHALVNSEVPTLGARHGVPAPVERVVRRMLAKRVQDRYASALELVRDLELLGDGPAAASRNTHAAPNPESCADSGDLLLAGERRPATVVVCNLPAFGELVEKLVPDEVKRILAEVVREAAEIASRLGGMLNQQRGEDLVLLFGVPVSHEDHAVRAVRAALELQARIQTLSARSERPELRLHMGVDTGPIVAYPSDDGERQYRVTGATAQTAARLAASAAPGEVWISAECQRLVGVFFETEAQQPLKLRDREKPLVPYHVVRHTGMRTRLEAAQRIGLTAHVGRERELGLLQAALDGALAGEGQLATVVGDAGLGKSRLVHEFQERLDTGSVRVLTGRCQSHGSSVAYLPFTGVLRAALGLNETDPADINCNAVLERVREIDVELEEFAPLYLQLLSVAGDESSISQPQAGAPQLHVAVQEALAALLTLCAREQPTLLLLEDWHWVDDPSHAALRQIVELAAGYRLLIVVTSRPGQAADWGVALHHTAITIEPLPLAASRAMLRSILQVDVFPEDLAALIHERTGGNPFFLEEICQALLEEGTLKVHDQHVLLVNPIDTLDLPDTVQAVIRTRIDRLDRDTREVLRLASVVGREFDRTVLEGALPEAGRLPNALQTLKSAGLIQQVRVVPEAVYRFKHVLTQEVTYSSLLEHQRKELHDRVARVIEQSDQARLEDHFDRLAHHFRRAENWVKAVEYGVRAAVRAEALSDFSEALQLVEQCRECLQHMRDSDEKQKLMTRVLLHEERMCETLGLRGRQQRIINELLSILDAERDEAQLAEVFVRQGDLCTLLRRFEEAETALEQSLVLRRRLGDPVAERNTLRSIGLLRWHQGRNQEALNCMVQTVALDRERNEPEALVADLSNQGAVLKALGDLPRAKAALEESLGLAEDLMAGGRSRTLGLKFNYILHNLANVHRELGDVDGALVFLERSKELTCGQRRPTMLAYHAYHSTSIAHLYLQQGRVEESIQLYQDAVAASRGARYTPGLSQTLRFLGEVLHGLSRHEEALPVLTEAARLFAQLEDPISEARMWSDAATAYEALGRQAEAKEAWERTRALSEREGDQRGLLAAQEGLARAARHTSDTNAAIEHYRAAVTTAEKLSESATAGRLRNSLAILEWTRGDYSSALVNYEKALLLFRDLGDEPSVGLMLNSIGVTLKQLGHIDQARARLQEALTVHRRAEQPRLEAHALAALGDLCHDTSEREEALRYYGESLRLRQELDDRNGEGWMLQRIARSRLLQGSPDGARELATRASRIADECSDDELRAACSSLVTAGS